jgi:hypothetical protein
MGRIFSVLLALWISAPALADAQAGAAAFDQHFTGRTLRFDYFHSGTAGQEHISLDRIRLEGPWPGSRTQLLDDTNLGKYLFQLVDPQSNQILYSRGFASIYGEWETTGEARRGLWQTLHESQRFPETKGKGQLVLKKRAPDGTFREIYSTLFDPASRFIDRSPLSSAAQPSVVFESGPAATKVDLLILGDGYTAAEAEKFRRDAERLAGYLFAAEPFKAHKQDFNVRALHAPSQDSGITDPRAEAWRNTALGLTYNAFDSERYVLTFANRELREVAAAAPYDALILLANNVKYGGGGIFNLWTTAAADNSQAAYLVVHEFGHSFAGLADEYYTSQVSYEEFIAPGVEPWEPNVTALLDPQELKWKDLVSPQTPLPTPWDQATYDEISLAYQKERQALRDAGAPEERMDQLFAEVKAKTEPLLQSQTHAKEIGAFEGAAYQAKNLYRPAIDCIMFTRNPDHFCPVCARALERVIGLYTR